jgi:hypothetical protein
MRVYLTHCSAKKDDSLKGTNRKVPPDRLYTSKRTQRFMTRCKREGVEWAIFSDLYGVWFPYEKNGWYEKHPSRVSDAEFRVLLSDSDAKLSRYDEIWFYYHPARLHRLYRRLLEESALRGRITRFTHLRDIS